MRRSAARPGRQRKLPPAGNCGSTNGAEVVPAWKGELNRLAHNLIEQILRPQFDRPALTGAADTEARIDDGVTVLLLCGNIPSRYCNRRSARIDIDQAGQPLCRDGGSGERSGHHPLWRVGQVVARRTRSADQAVRPARCDQIVAILRFSQGEAEAERHVTPGPELCLDFDALRSYAVSDVVRSAGPVAALRSWSAPLPRRGCRSR